MAEEKPLLLKDDDLPRLITTKKLNSLKYLAWAHAEVFLRREKEIKINYEASSSTREFYTW